MGKEPDGNTGVSMEAIYRNGRDVGEDATTHQEAARLVLADIENGLRFPKDGVTPLKVPSPHNRDSFYILCILLLENDWLKQNALIISFPAREGGRIIGFVLKSDRIFWTSPQALQHLNCRGIDIGFYTVEEYVGLVLDGMRKEKGIRD